MKKFIKFILGSLKIFIVSFFFILFLDFLIGERVLNLIDPYLKETEFYDKRSRISHPVFHHTFRGNINFKSAGFNQSLRICANEHGFKSSCEYKKKNTFEFGLIGDSFTEGIGLNYEDTFSGVFEKKSNFDVANLGVSSYSSKIYLSKLNHYLNKGIRFNHIIIFLDISDYYDDAYYNLDLESLRIIHTKREKFKIKLRKNFPFTNYYFYVIKKLRNSSQDNKEISIKEKILSKDQVNIKKLLNSESVNKKTSWIYANKNDFKMNNKNFLLIHSEMKLYLNQINELLKKNDTKFSLAIYPWPHNLQTSKNTSFYRNEWKEFCVSKCEFFFDFFEEFEKKLKNDNFNKVYKKYYFSGDVHFNKEGNKIIADKLWKIIVNK